MASNATHRQRWYRDHDAVWPGEGDRIDVNDLANAELVALMDPHVALALVPALRYAATIAYVAAAADGPTQAAVLRIVDYLAVFARRVLREEETGG